jgi:hypothetical protein
MAHEREQNGINLSIEQSTEQTDSHQEHEISEHEQDSVSAVKVNGLSLSIEQTADQTDHHQTHSIGDDDSVSVVQGNGVMAPERPTPITIGATYTWQLHGKIWPVVVCEDDTPPKKFMEGRQDPILIPAILLGRRRYIWVRDDPRLQEADNRIDYLADIPSFNGEDIFDEDEEDTKLEKERRKAFEQDMMIKTELPPHEYWKNFINQQSEERKMKREWESQSTSPGMGSTSSKKRKAKQGSQLLTPGPTPSKNVVYSSKGSRHSDDSGDELFVHKARKMRGNPFVANGHGETNGAIPECVPLDPSKQIRTFELTEISSDDQSTVKVGRNGIPFSIPRSVVLKCGGLAHCELITPDGDSIVDISDVFDIDLNNFVHVCNYFRTGDFEPQLVEGKHGIYELEDWHNLDTDEQIETVARIAKVFRTASDLKHSGLQELAFEKLRAVYPLPVPATLTVALVVIRNEQWDDGIEAEVQDWVADAVVEHFYEMMRGHGVSFAHLLQRREEFAAAVYDKLARALRG